MIDYLIGVDGGGTNTRVRVARRDGALLATGKAGASGLGHGIAKAWTAVDRAVAEAFAAIGIDSIPRRACAIGLGMAGVHNKEWAAAFAAANPEYAAVRLDTDAFSTLMGAHDGRPGAIVAIGTGSVGEALRADGSRVEVGGWGFPSGDEAGGAWMGMRAIGHVQQVLDGRADSSAFARDVAAACGGTRDAIQVWLGKATQTDYAGLAHIVVAHGALHPLANAILDDAGREVARMAHALDPDGMLPLSLCGGLGETLRLRLPADLMARCSPAHGDSAQGALRMIALHLQEVHA